MYVCISKHFRLSIPLQIWPKSTKPRLISSKTCFCISRLNYLFAQFLRSTVCSSKIVVFFSIDCLPLIRDHQSLNALQVFTRILLAGDFLTTNSWRERRSLILKTFLDHPVHELATTSPCVMDG